jgi:hypothetical protein
LLVEQEVLLALEASQALLVEQVVLLALVA